MRNIFRYIALVFVVASFFACDDDSIQQRREKEKAERLQYLKENNIPESARLTSGLYFISIKEGEGMDPEDYEVGKHKMSVYYTFYYLDGGLIAQKGLGGKIESFTFNYGDYNIKPAFREAVSKMKVGGKARLIIPSSLNTGQPYTGVEVTSTNQFYTVICDLELSEVSESQDPDNQF